MTTRATIPVRAGAVAQTTAPAEASAQAGRGTRPPHSLADYKKLGAPALRAVLHNYRHETTVMMSFHSLPGWISLLLNLMP